MFRPVFRPLLTVGLALCASGCFVVGPFPIPLVQPARPAPGNALPTPFLPALYVEHGGQRASTVEQFYTWNSGSGISATSGTTPLAVPLGEGLDIVVNFNSPPAVLWVAELDGNGVPRAASVLTPTAMTAVYTPTVSGQYRLQITAEWTYQNTVTNLFPLDVRP